MRGIEETIEKLINSKLIKEWINLFQQKIKNTRLRNSEYMNLYSEVEQDYFLFADEDKKLFDIDVLEKKVIIKSQKRVEMLEKYQEATDNNNKKLMKNLESKILKINEKFRK